MVRIVIIGWYGTETIGDRAILAGLMNVFGQCFDSFEIILGSLFPFYSERTIFEDYGFYKRISNNKLQGISIFDSQRINEMRGSIGNSDFVFFGGGPIMDDDFLFLIEYAFKCARKKKKLTGVLGCGLGPLTNEKYVQCTVNILRMSDVIILRDRVSLKYIEPYYNNLKIIYAIDPALFAADFFRNNVESNNDQNPYVAVNFRDLNYVNKSYTGNEVNNLFHKILDLEQKTNSLEIQLVPNHTFVIGGDDRYYLNNILKEYKKDGINVQNIPLSLEQTMKVYQNAAHCYGMRFHTALLMTVLNGKAFVLDYTDPEKGKIIGLLTSLNLLKRYKESNRYVNLLNGSFNSINPDFNTIITVSTKDVELLKGLYINTIKELIKN